MKIIVKFLVIFSLSTELFVQSSILSKSQTACASFNVRPTLEDPLPELHLESYQARVGEFPSVVGISYNSTGDFRCTGVLISDRFVLTSANCVALKELPPVFIRLGRTSVSLDDSRDTSEAVDVDIEEIIIHPNFKRAKKVNAIALVKLQKPVTFTHFIYPACLNLDSTYTTEQLVSAGFSTGVFNKVQIPKSSWLLKNHINEVPIEDCIKIYPTYRVKISDSHLCALDKFNQNDLCAGASGGPLGRFVNGKFYLYGLISFGTGCGTPVPSVYVRVSKYADWIENIVWE